MRLLIDTHVLIWWQKSDPRLNARARALLADPRSELVVSIASLWEMSLKFRIGKLDVAGSDAWAEAFEGRCSVLSINARHLVALERLPSKPEHKDPFDHLILAQAAAERIPLVTNDKMMTGYGVSCIGAG